MQNYSTGATAQLISATEPAAYGSTPVSPSGPASQERPIQLCLLGPLSLVRAGRQVTPSAPKLRQVLSLLAVQANSVTRIDQLIEELWHDSPPPSALTTVQTYIYQLRKLLRLTDRLPTESEPDEAGAQPDGAEICPALLSHPGGYILQLPDLNDIDANLFEQLTRRGRQELLGQRVSEAATTFREALGLWHGGFLEGVTTGPLLYAHATRLDELRRTALALRIESDLRLGRHQELIGELTSLVSSEPTREDFSAKLMIALYRSGRRADALGVYQRIRTTMVDELGLDPASELQRLHQLILEADAELDLPEDAHPGAHPGAYPGAHPDANPATASTAAMSAPEPARPTPAQLPPEIPDFVGRDDELARVAGLLDGTTDGLRVVNVTGRPGIGKSAFVTRAARLVRDNYPDGQLYYDLTGGDQRPLPPRQILVGMLRALGADEADIPSGLGEAALMFRSWTADRRLLVVLDQADSTETLRHLAPSGPGSALVVTSRTPVEPLAGTTRLRLPALTDAESIELLDRAIGSARVAAEPDAAARLAELADRMPLALRAITARLAARPGWRLSRLVSRLDDERTRLAELRYGGFTVADRIAEEYLARTASQRWVFRRLGTADGPATPTELAELASMALPAVHAALDELTDADLVEEIETGEDEPRYRIPTLIRLVGMAGAPASSWWTATTDRI